MQFETKLVHGKLIKRYKRFLADILLDDGLEITAHCTNSGSMKSCIEEGAEVYLTYHGENTNRKTLYTWEMIRINGKWVGVNTGNPNKLAFEIVAESKIKQLKGYTKVKREVKWGDSRFDVYAENEHEKCFIEVKNVTYKVEDYALFPDAVTTRGQKHLETLVKLRKEGYRAVMLYIVQRTDIDFFGPATHIDPDYASKLLKAINNGVEVIPLMVNVEPTKIEVIKELPLVFEIPTEKLK